ncbi:hypothetical protein LUZ60_015749 [Juncus effusus]|nr:hypothetical protein LUZ60_015749 [Juncus effusus]
MAEAIPPLRSLPPDAPLPAPFQTPPISISISAASLPSSSRQTDKIEGRDQGEFPYRFQRTDLWQPAYKWLESLEKETLVTHKEVSDWLDANPNILQRLAEKHSRYHLVHYTQRMHLKLLKKRGKLPKSVQLSAARASIKPLIGWTEKQKVQVTPKIIKREIPVPGNSSGGVVRDKKMLLSKKREACIKYELLTDLQNQLISMLTKKHKSPPEIKTKSKQLILPQTEPVPVQSQTGTKSPETGITTQPVNPPLTKQKSDESIKEQIIGGNVDSKAQLEGQIGNKRKRSPILVTPAWSYTDASFDYLRVDQASSSNTEENTRRTSIWKRETESDKYPLEKRRKSIVPFIQGRERGASWRSSSSYQRYAGRDKDKWVPFFQGWDSIGKQFEGSTLDIKRRSYKSWIPTWCSHTSVVQTGQQDLQKVLHVKFHPDGLPQLICGSNKGPNELLLYNLRSGRPLQLKGHTSQIQAVDFAVRGASVVSCSSNLLKVWDCITGSCLYTLGENNQNGTGHTERINAMAVNKWQSCLVVTSGAKGDGKLLLWNALRGELASDLNINMRSNEMVYPSIITMEFCKENLLICGSDIEHGGSSMVQLWDLDCVESVLSFSASDSYISSLKVHPSGNTIITGSGDGTIGLFDIRTCSPINHLSVGPACEVNSVLFSGCGTYFSASGTTNNSLVWDTRFVPTNTTNKDLRFFRPLHCLSHGNVDSLGDQGVNGARWLQREPVLVTASGDGSMVMWDVTLGRPFVRRIVGHTQCVNTLDAAPNDEYLCTGGDDKKIVLYHNKNGSTRLNWRLTQQVTAND